MKRLLLLLFPFGVILLSLLILKIFEDKNTKKIIGDGFINAKATESNKYVCNATNILCVKKLIKDFQKTNNNILILGNSQLGAINNMNESDMNYGEILSLKLKRNYPSLSIKSIWLPNASFNEFKILISSIDQCSKKNNDFILPLFLDDTREIVVRNSLLDYSEKLCGNYQSNKNNKLKKLNNKISITRSEKISEYLISNLPIIKKLERTNKKFKIFIYQLRNTIFNIKPTSARRVIPAAYNSNINSLKKMVNYNKRKKIIYIPPLLNSSSKNEIPYNLKEYEKFKKDLETYCSPKKNCKFYNLESLVPNNVWGGKSSTSLNKSIEIDFMHFTYKGHQIISEELIKLINENKLGE